MSGRDIKGFVLGASAALFGLGVYAFAVTLPNTFTSGSTISSSQVNANFAALKAAVDALEARQTLVGKRGLHGYAWANDPTSASYTPNATYSFNSSGGAIVATRSGPGVYQITFNGLGRPESGGHVQVTAYGGNSNYCKVGGWSSVTDVSVNVQCYSPGGTPADSQYDIQVTW